MSSPVVIFVYKRLAELKKTFEALALNDLAQYTDLYVFSDGPKTKQDIQSVNEVRDYLSKLQGFASIQVVHRDKNFGLAKNIIEGVTQVLTVSDTVIVLEDDIVVSAGFLSYMNKALDLYSSDSNVCQVSGYSYLENYAAQYQLGETYFILGADCLAWGTWRRAWKGYRSDSLTMLDEILRDGLHKKFNRDGAYNYSNMLRQTGIGEVNSWAINWYASNFLTGRYTLYPLRSLAVHIGVDEGATNYSVGGVEDPLHVKVSQTAPLVSRIPIEEKKSTTMAYNDFLRKSRGSFIRRLQAWSAHRMKKYFRKPLA